MMTVICSTGVNQATLITQLRCDFLLMKLAEGFDRFHISFLFATSNIGMNIIWLLLVHQRLLFWSTHFPHDNVVLENQSTFIK